VRCSALVLNPQRIRSLLRASLHAGDGTGRCNQLRTWQLHFFVSLEKFYQSLPRWITKTAEETALTETSDSKTPFSSSLINFLLNEKSSRITFLGQSQGKSTCAWLSREGERPCPHPGVLTHLHLHPAWRPPHLVSPREGSRGMLWQRQILHPARATPGAFSPRFQTALTESWAEDADFSSAEYNVLCLWWLWTPCSEQDGAARGGRGCLAVLDRRPHPFSSPGKILSWRSKAREVALVEGVNETLVKA